MPPSKRSRAPSSKLQHIQEEEKQDGSMYTEGGFDRIIDECKNPNPMKLAPQPNMNLACLFGKAPNHQNSQGQDSEEEVEEASPQCPHDHGNADRSSAYRQLVTTPKKPTFVEVGLSPILVSQKESGDEYMRVDLPITPGALSIGAFLSWVLTSLQEVCVLIGGWFLALRVDAVAENACKIILLVGCLGIFAALFRTVSEFLCDMIILRIVDKEYRSL